MKKIKKNWLEWTVFAIGLALVAFAFGYLLYAGVTAGEVPASLEVRLGKPEQRPHNFVVPVTVLNHGDETATSVRIEVVINRDGDEMVVGQLEIPLVPRHSTREGWVTFEQDPSTAQLRARVAGYQKP